MRDVAPFANDSEWTASSDVRAMWGVLQARATDRKKWLFACACCRQLPGYLESEDDRLVLEAAERHVEGVDSLAAMLEHFDGTKWDIRFHRLNPTEAVNRTLESIWVRFDDDESAWAEYAELLRDIFLSPFRTVRVEASWLTPWVVTLAQQIYQERAFNLMSALASELEKAGCRDADVLLHCRQPGRHVRGCWVVDQLLGKE